MESLQYRDIRHNILCIFKEYLRQKKIFIAQAVYPSSVICYLVVTESTPHLVASARWAFGLL